MTCVGLQFAAVQQLTHEDGGFTTHRCLILLLPNS